MKNLFRRIYIKHDSHLAVNANQERFVITSRKLIHPFPADPAARQRMGVLDVVDSLEALDRRYGGREEFWSYLRAHDGRVAIIAGRLEVMELLIQYWKSILKSPTPESLYRLYQYFINSENLYALTGSGQIMVDANTEADRQNVLIVASSLEDFTAVYERTPATWTLSELKHRDIPIEYLLANYFGASSQLSAAKSSLGKITFSKVYDIVLANILAQLISAKRDYFLNTHNFYRLHPEAKEGDVFDPIAEIQANPNLAWVLDDDFRADNVQGILDKYTLSQIQGFFSVYKKLFDYDLESAFALDYIARDDVAGLLEYDVADEVGNFFGAENFAFKVNGLFVSHLYQLYRRDRKDVLAEYTLR